MESVAQILFLTVWGAIFFVVGYRWGYKVVTGINEVIEPISRGKIFPGQRWRIPGVGTVIIYDVWPETVSYYLSKRDPDEEIGVYTMNRPDFEEGARDEQGRDGRGMFRTPEDRRVLKFEIIHGEKK